MTLYIIFGLIIFYVFVSVINRRRLKNKVEESIQWSSTLGTSIAINGKKRAGKTTSGAGFVHYFTQIIISKLRRIMDDSRKILKTIDFNTVEKIFIEELSSSQSYDKALNKVIENFNDGLFELDEYYYDYLSLKEKYKILEEYIEAWFILNVRKSFTYSKGWFFNRIMMESSMLFDPSSIELRNVLVKLNWQIDIANIIFDDERSMDAGNVDSNKRVIKLSGSKEFNSLLANMFRELTYKIVIKQNSKDEINQERQLIDSNLFIYGRRILGSFTLIRYSLELFLYFVFLPFRFTCWIRRVDFEQYQKRSNWLRRLEYKIFRMSKALESFGYIKVRFLNYYDADDVGKRNPDLYEQFDCFFPIRYCYGVVDTYEYNCLLPYFKNLSDKSVIDKTSKFATRNRVHQYIKKLSEREF